MAALSDPAVPQPNALKYTGIYPMLPDSLKEYLEKCSKSDKGKILRMIASLTERRVLKAPWKP